MGNFFSRQHFEIFLLHFLRKQETICLKCQILFKGQIKTNVTNLSTAELAERVVRIKISSKKKINRILKPFLLIHVHYLDKKM